MQPTAARKPLKDIPKWIWWAAAGVFILLFFLRDFRVQENGLIAGEVFWGRDFINVWTGGQLVRDGKLAVLYDLHAYAEYQRSLFGAVGPHNYSYPPVTFPLAALFSILPYWLSLAVWTTATGALFAWAAKPWWPKAAGPVWLAVLTPAALINIWAGHYGFLIGALFLLGWTRLDDRPVQAGIFFGLMLIKPHLAVLVPLALLVRREWTAIISAAATVAVLVAGTGLWFGWQSWAEFLFRTSGVQASMIDSGSSFFGLLSCSPATAMLRLTDSWAAAMAVQCAASAAAAAAVVYAASTRASTRDLAFLLATATFLFLPYSFGYDLTVVMVGAILLWYGADADDRQRHYGLFGFIVPQLGLAPKLGPILAAFAPLGLAALLYGQVSRIRLLHGRDPSPSPALA